MHSSPGSCSLAAKIATETSSRMRTALARPLARNRYAGPVKAAITVVGAGRITMVHCGPSGVRWSTACSGYAPGE